MVSGVLRRRGPSSNLCPKCHALRLNALIVHFVTTDSNSPAVPAIEQVPVVVDIDLDDVDEPEFTPQVCRAGGDVYVLSLKDDYLLAEFSAWARDGDVFDLYENFYAETLVSGTDSDGMALSDAFKHLWDKVEKREISLRKISKMAQDAVEVWTEELTDTSMRPGRRNRADRRSAKRRR